MVRAKVEIVCTPVQVRERSHRTLDQRLSLRFPRLTAALLRRIGRLPPSSRLRRATLSRSVQLAAEAYNRRDLDIVVLGYHPEIEYRPAHSWVEAGFFEPCYRGPEGYRRYVAITAEVFGAEVYFKPVELVDGGERLVVLADVPMRAQASGIPLTEKFAYVATLKDGKVIRMEEYYDHDEALEAAGLADRGT
jgi:ketosteroid isomerase-like protein